jgi:uncharacterized membrane protein
MLKTILNELFYVLTGALLVFVFLEIIRPGIVLAYINLNIVLLFWLVVGIIAVVKGQSYKF